MGTTNDNADYTKEVETLGIEVALLIAAAYGKGIDVPVWIAAPQNGIIPLNDLYNKLVSLSLAVGFQEEWETKRELELAVSKPSLKVIQFVCAIEGNNFGEPLVDTRKFLRLCDIKVRSYLQTLAPGNSHTK